MSTQFIEPIAALECLQNEFNSETKEFKNTLNLNDMIKLDIVKSPHGNSFNMKAQQGNIVFNASHYCVFDHDRQILGIYQWEKSFPHITHSGNDDEGFLSNYLAKADDIVDALIHNDRVVAKQDSNNRMVVQFQLDKYAKIVFKLDSIKVDQNDANLALINQVNVFVLIV
jgi:hypothetical protein